MKSERRHELKQNELAQRVGASLQLIQPYWRWIAGVAVMLATGVFVVRFISNSQHKAQQVGWMEFLEAVADRNPDALLQVADDHAGDSVAPWAQHVSAQAKLIEASSAIYFDRAAAQKDFRLAVDGFNAVLGQTTETLLRQRAQFGLGQAYEGLNELDKAMESYEVFATGPQDGKLENEDWSESAIGRQAQRRIDSLREPQTKEFYKWFFAQEPPAPILPAWGDSPGLPFGQLPSEPDITFPDFPQSNDLDIDFETPLDDAAETPDVEIFDTLDTDAAETLELDAPKTSDADAAETDPAEETAGSGTDTDTAKDSNKN